MRSALIRNLFKAGAEIKSIVSPEAGFDFIPAALSGLDYPLDFAFTLDQDKRFYPKKDKDGIPLSSYASVGLQYNPTKIAGYALSNFNRWIITSEAEHYDRFLAAAEWFLRDSNGRFPYAFAWEGMEPGWISAMAQGQAISVLARAYVTAGRPEFHEQAIKAIQPLQLDLKHGGLRSHVDDEIVFLEEYPLLTPRHTLNGHLFTLIGLSDLRFFSAGYLEHYEISWYLSSLEKILGRYDLGFWSKYDLHEALGRHPNPATYTYHTIHVSQLMYLGSLFNRVNLKNVAIRWSEYKLRTANRLKALIAKLRYRKFETAQR